MKHLTRITITGHRPSKLGGYDSNDPLNVAVKEALRARMRSAVEKFGNVVFNIGMAIGVDQMAAEICVEEGWLFDAYIPCYNQQGRWPKAAQDHYEWLLKHAREKFYTIEGPYPGAWILQKRNEDMVDNADYLLSVWNESSGGTANCIAYANRKGFKEEKRWVNIDPRHLTKGA